MVHKMKVAIVSTHYEEEVGGAEISSKLLVDGLIKAGHSVDVLSFGSKLSWLPLGLKAFLLNTDMLDSYVEKWLVSLLSGKEYDVVHFQDLMLLVGGVRACRRLKLKSVATVRDLRFICNLPTCQEAGELKYGCSDREYLKCLKGEAGSRYGVGSLAYFIKPFIRERSDYLCGALYSVDNVIAISKFVRSELKKVDIKSAVVYNPMPSWKCKRVKSSEFTLLTPSRLESYKGIQYAIRAVAEVAKVRPNVRYYIAGTGGYEKDLKKLVASLGVGANVKFLGKVPYAEIKDWYCKADLVLMPSLWLEPLGRLGLDTMAAGGKIIGSDVGGIAEVIGKENTCDVKDVSSFAVEILRRRARLKKRSEFSVKEFVEKVEGIYRMR